MEVFLLDSKGLILELNVEAGVERRARDRLQEGNFRNHLRKCELAAIGEWQLGVFTIFVLEGGWNSDALEQD